MPENDLLVNEMQREFEAQLNVRFKAIAARFVLADERFLALAARLDTSLQGLVQQRSQAQEARRRARSPLARHPRQGRRLGSPRSGREVTGNELCSR